MDNAVLITWDYLKTISGAAFMTFLIVQYTKNLLDQYKWLKVPTDVYAVLVAYVVYLTSQLSGDVDAYDWKVYVLSFFNAFIISMVAGQLLNKAINPPDVKKGEDSNE